MMVEVNKHAFFDQAGSVECVPISIVAVNSTHWVDACDYED